MTLDVETTEAIERAYHLANETLQPRVLLVPTSPHLPPVDPVTVAGQWARDNYLAMCVYAGILRDFYQTPSVETIDRAIGELTTMRDALMRAPASE